MRSSSGSAGGCLVIPLILVPFLIGGFIVLVMIVNSAFSGSDFEKQMDAGHLTIVEPQTLQGRTPVTDGTFDKGNAERVADLQDLLTSPSTFSTAYHAPGKDVIIVAASKGVFIKSADRIDALLSVPIGDGVVDVRSIEPGPFGGVAKCGTKVVENGETVGVCAWIDDGTAGAVAVYRSDAEKAGGILVAVRDEVERRI